MESPNIPRRRNPGNAYRLFANSDSDDARNAAGGQEVIFSIGISSRNSRCLCFAMFMNAQIGQTEKEILSCTKMCCS